MTTKISPAIAKQLWDWFKTRSGVLIWKSANLSNPVGEWFTPMFDAEGISNISNDRRPNWQCADISTIPPNPVVMSNPNEVLVVIPKEVKRFRIALRRSGNGLSIKLTDHSSKRVHDETAKAKDKHGDAFYEFDYSTQEAVILVPAQEIPLPAYMSTAFHVVASSGDPVVSNG